MAMIPFDQVSFMKLGLETAGFSRWEMYLEHTNIDRFRGWYGSRPTVCETVWRMLQWSVNEECRIGSDANPMHLLLALRFLKAYSTELELAGQFKITEKAVQKWSGMYVRKINLLLEEMVSDCRIEIEFLF